MSQNPEPGAEIDMDEAHGHGSSYKSLNNVNDQTGASQSMDLDSDQNCGREQELQLFFSRKRAIDWEDDDDENDDNDDNNDDDDDDCSLESHTFDYEERRKALAKMIIIDKLPFWSVKREWFRKFMHTLLPSFTIPSSAEVARDCIKLFVEERKKLWQSITGRRVCLSTDIWSCIHNFTYMCLTAHWIDDEWKLNKRIINFRQIPDRRGKTIGEEIEVCLVGWGIHRILTVTVDDSSSNDLLIEHLKSKTEKWKSSSTILENEFLHVRSYVHILALVVEDLFKEESDTIVKIRNAVRYIYSDSTTYEKFQKCIEEEKIESNSLLYLDIETKWNSTYLMLEKAVKIEKAFERLIDDDPSFEAYFDGIEVKSKPNEEDWKRARILVKFLSMFYDLTLKFSGSLQVTSSACFLEMVMVQALINEWIESRDIMLSDMARNMKLKLERYWENFNNTNYLLYIAAVLDPRCKLELLSFCLGHLYDEEKTSEVTSKVESALRRLYEFYESTCPVNDGPLAEMTVDGKDGRDESIGGFWRAKYIQYLKKKNSMENKSELDRYLLAGIVDDDEDFDILTWWKGKQLRYPRLSKMAMEVLAVPVSTVASKSAFSANGNVLDEYMSYLYPRTMEALICTRSWLCTDEASFDLRKEVLDAEKYDEIDKEMPNPFSWLSLL